MSAYATHLTILESLFDSFKIGGIFEFGSGDNSTPLFIKKAAGKVLSIEMQDVQWFVNVYNKYKTEKNFIIHCMLGSDAACEYLELQRQNFDLIFVDGHAERYKQVTSSFNKTKLIIAHDTSLRTYGWFKISLPNGWVWIDIINFDPWTSVITNDPCIIEWCKNFNHVMYAKIEDKDYKYK